MNHTRLTSDDRPKSARPQRWWPWWSIGLLLPILTGCAVAGRSPEIDVYGSYWPAWMICIIAGLILMSCVRLLLIWLRIDARLWPAPLVYLCLSLIFALGLWLLFFNR